MVSGFGIEDTLNYGIDNDLGLFYSSDLTIVLNNYKTKEELDLDVAKLDGLEYYEYSIHQSSEAYKDSSCKMSSTIYIIPNEGKAVKVDFPINSCMVSKNVA